VSGSGEEKDRPDERSRSAPIGKGDTYDVSGSDVRQPEIAEGPVEGLQPGEEVERGPWRPPVEVGPPQGYGHPPDEEAAEGPGGGPGKGEGRSDQE
jgi:hypothetical protein